MIYNGYNMVFMEKTMKKVSVQEFINANPKAQGQSKLTPFKDDILFLKSQGYTGKQILLFLAQNDVAISPNALNVFIRKHINGLTSTPSHQTEVSPPVEQPDSKTTSAPVETQNQAETASKLKPKTGIKKFNWKNASTEGLI